jgi:hypothetical protein
MYELLIGQEPQKRFVPGINEHTDGMLITLFRNISCVAGMLAGRSSPAKNWLNISRHTLSSTCLASLTVGDHLYSPCVGAHRHAKECAEEYRLYSDLARHVVDDHDYETASLGPEAKPYMVEPLETPRSLPKIVPSYVASSVEVYGAPISQERRDKLGPWVRFGLGSEWYSIDMECRCCEIFTDMPNMSWRMRLVRVGRGWASR